LKENGKAVIGIGKIYDIFAGKGITDCDRQIGNNADMKITSKYQAEDWNGLCFTNLVDFDMQYGHRRDPEGYTAALNDFDKWLGDFMRETKPDDVLIITADHGCDPCHNGTDHTREYIPVLIFGDGIVSSNLGTRDCFGDIGATVLGLLGVDGKIDGESFADLIMR
ncbi:MAG: alkaline phosphatase family protein, partial [Oscillospiraceae bacterium]|nr:alkaline phosphatase family protein [Oscillospiraceae bacterium]